MLTGTLVTAAGFLPSALRPRPPANMPAASSGRGDRADRLVVRRRRYFTPYLGVKLLPDFSGARQHDEEAIYHTRAYRASCAG